jgi:hypothetical protein
MGASVGCTDDRKDMDGDSGSDDDHYDIRREARRPPSRGGKTVTIDDTPSHDDDHDLSPKLENEVIRIQKMWRGRKLQKKPQVKDAAGAIPGIPRIKSQYAEPLLNPAPELDDDEFAEEEAEGQSLAKFKNDVGKASRTAMACLICSLCVLVPDWYRQIDPAYSSMIGGGVVLMVVFTVFDNLGLTAQLAWQGFIGTFMSCVPVHVLAAQMPGGAAFHKEHPAESHYSHSVVHATNIVVIFLGLWLNISKNAKMFFVCYHVYFIIDFMNPESQTKFNDTWHVDMTATTTTTLVTSTMGLCVAVFVVLFPWPIRATTDCRLQAVVSINMLTDLVDGLTVYFAGDEQSVRIVRMESATVKLRQAIEGMGANIDGSWWETFNIGPAGKSRALLQRHLKMLTRMSDIAFSLQVCIAKEDFGSTHVSVMGMIGPQVSELVNKTKYLLRLATLAANDGRIDDKEQKRLREGIKEVSANIRGLAVAFNDARKEVSPDRRICSELQSESFYCYSLSAYGRQAVEYAQDMLDKPPKFGTPELPSLLKDLETAFVGIFDAKKLFSDADHRSFTARNTLSVVIAFYIGFWFKGYDAAAAGTVAVLISTFSGSALQKNLNRLQAVTLAAILPHLIASMMGQSCSPPRILMQCVAIVLYEVITCYIYYSSATYGYVGCLIAALGVSNLIYPCKEHTSLEEMQEMETTFGVASFKKIVDTTLAVIVMTVVDLAMASSTAGKQATESYLHALLTCDAFFQACLCKQSAKGKIADGEIVARLGVEVEDRRVIQHVAKAHSHRNPGVILNYLNLAVALGEEANKEPRYHRVPWPADYFTSLVKSGYVLRGNLVELEHVLLVTGTQKGEHWDIFESCRVFDSYKKVQEDIVDTLSECLLMVQKILKNDWGESCHSLLTKLDDLEKIDKLQDLPDLMNEINESQDPNFQYPPEITATLEDDLLCRLNVALMMMESTVEKIADMIKASIKQLV